MRCSHTVHTIPTSCLQAAKKAETVLTQQRYAQLDALLNKAGMYTQFLTEQMQAYAAPGGASGSTQEGEGDEEAEEETAGVWSYLKSALTAECRRAG